MRSHADVDPDAPPAMKASPSVSGDDAGLPLPNLGLLRQVSHCS